MTGPVSYTHLDVYKRQDWKKYLVQRETDEKRRKRERANAERKAARLLEQSEKLHAKATKATAAPVSYTHLDVYKRQGQQGGAEAEALQHGGGLVTEGQELSLIHI